MNAIGARILSIISEKESALFGKGITEAIIKIEKGGEIKEIKHIALSSVWETEKEEGVVMV